MDKIRQPLSPTTICFGSWSVFTNTLRSMDGPADSVGIYLLEPGEDVNSPGGAAVIKPDGTREELPPLVYEAVQHVIEAMGAGMAVKVSPFRPELPIDEAAAAIGMAKDDLRYYVAAGELPFRSTEYVDWVRLSDVMAFDRRRREHCRAGVRELLDEEPWDEASDDLRQE